MNSRSGKLRKFRWISAAAGLSGGLFVGVSAQAQISDAFRAENAVVLYEFDETSGPVLDTGNAKFPGAPINLSIAYPGSASRSGGVLEISAKNLIMSDAPATKLINECKKTNELTIEVTLQNNEPSINLTGEDSDQKAQPLRIVSLATGLKDRNFIFGQVYDGDNGGEFFRAAIGIGNGNSLNEPLASPLRTTFIDGTKQTVIISRSRSGAARMYMSDKLGNMYLARTDQLNFRGDFSKWNDQARISLGNEVQPMAKYLVRAGLEMPEFNLRPVPGKDCGEGTNELCLHTPIRPWKGRLDRVAIYCQALTETQILGPKLTEKKQEAIQIGTAPITDARKRAAELYTRLAAAKVPIDHPKLIEMESFINSNELMKAAAIATEVPNFFNITVRDFAARMSNREETINVPLNDFTATVIGVARDNRNARELLYNDLTYLANPAKAAVPTDMAEDVLKSNNHYEALDNGKYDLTQVLVASTQRLISSAGVTANPTPAGLLTSRAFLAAHGIAGTNRRLVEFSFRQFLCAPIDKWADSSGPDSFIGKDIDRFPGGEHSKFTSSCRSCHSGMDGLRGAFARYTFSNGFVKHTNLLSALVGDANEDEKMEVKLSGAQLVVFKMNQNSQVFASGKTVTDDSWENFAKNGTNKAFFGWPQKTTGKGVTEFGRMLSESKAFPRCMAERVYKTVCKRNVTNYETGFINQVGEDFAQNGYSLKYLFQRVAVAPECLGGGK